MCLCVDVTWRGQFAGLNALQNPDSEQSWGCLLCTSLQAPEISILLCGKATSLVCWHTFLTYRLFLDQFVAWLMVLCFCLLVIFGIFRSLDGVSR